MPLLLFLLVVLDCIGYLLWMMSLLLLSLLLKLSKLLLLLDSRHDAVLWMLRWSSRRWRVVRDCYPSLDGGGMFLL
jgi:hypothetical protein